MSETPKRRDLADHDLEAALTTRPDPASSGPAALVERLGMLRPVDGVLVPCSVADFTAWARGMTDEHACRSTGQAFVLEALAQGIEVLAAIASPAPACASCAAKDEHIEAARVAIAQAQEWAEKWKALAFREQALQQSQAQEIERLKGLNDKWREWAAAVIAEDPSEGRRHSCL